MKIDRYVQEDYKRSIYVEGIKAFHFVVTIVIFYVFWLLFRYGRLRGMDTYAFRYNYYVALGYAVAVFFFNRTYNAYLFGFTRIRSLVFSQLLSQLFSAGITWLAVSVGWRKFHAPWVLFGAIGLQAVLDVAWSYFGSYVYFRLYPAKRTILIYRNALDKKRFGTTAGKPMERLYRVVEEFRYEGNSFREIRHRLEGYEAVFVAGVHSRCRNGIAKYCKEVGIDGFFLPHVGDVIMQEAQHIQSFDAPVLFVSRSVPKPEYRVAKRAFDIAASGLGLLLLSPLLLVTALAIRLYDGGPAIYKQVRLTRGGKPFKIWKFRSMRVDAERDGVARLSTGENDERITPIGRVVRACRLDELPQLVNIFLGDMSFVGPRPERPEIAAQYEQTMPDFKLRLQVKAGLTGYAQVYGKYNIDPYEKLEFDLLYINDMSMLTDIKLIFATVAILFSSESTKGVDPGAVTAMDYEDEADRPD